MMLIGGLGLVAAFMGFLIWNSNEENKLIKKGECIATDRALYQPAPTYIVPKDGGVAYPMHHNPYFRIYYTCKSGRTFWRRE